MRAHIVIGMRGTDMRVLYHEQESQPVTVWLFVLANKAGLPVGQ